MKKGSALAAVLLGVTLTSSVSWGETFLNNEKLELTILATPKSEAKDFETTLVKKARNWIKVKFTYKTPKPTKQPKYKSYKLSSWQDDITVEAKVLIPSLTTGKPVIAMLNGQTIYSAIKKDGMTHQGRFFISPYVLERHLRPGGGFPSKSSLKDISVQLTFKDKSSKTIGMLFYGGGKSELFTSQSGKKIGAKFKAADSSAKVLKIENSILSTNETPWAYSHFDSYENIKPTKGRK